MGCAQQGDPVAPGPAACAGNAQQGIPGRGKVRQLQAVAAGKAQHQRQAQQGRVNIHAHQAHQAQRGGVGTNQDVLAVVQDQGGSVGAGDGERARPPAHGACGLEYRGLVARLCGGNGRSQAGPTSADDGNVHACCGVNYMRPRACIFQASQNLRSGVRLMRWCSTWKLSCSISRSKVR